MLIYSIHSVGVPPTRYFETIDNNQISNFPGYTGSSNFFDPVAAINFDPISIFIRTINLGGEYSLNDRLSVELGLAYTFFNDNSSYGPNNMYRGWMVEPELKWFFSGEVFKGYYIGPYFRFFDINLTYNQVNFYPYSVSRLKHPIVNFGGGLILGKEWEIGERFILDGFIGPGYLKPNDFVKNNDQIGSYDVEFTGIICRFGFLFGIKV